MSNITYTHDRPVVAASPAFSIPSIIAIIAAVGSFMVGPGLQLILGIVAAVFGVIGVVIALLPSKRGGIISVLSIVIGALALLIAIVRFIAGLA